MSHMNLMFLCLNVTYDTRENSHSRSSNYAASTSSSMRGRDLNHTQQIGQFRNQSRKDTESREPKNIIPMKW